MAYELTYTPIDDNAHYKVSGYTGTPVDVVIPAEYDGKPVTEIGGAVNTAFMGCQTIKSVTIPNSVVKIGDYAFCACPALVEVVMGNAVQVIGANAFSGCTALPSVIIPAVCYLIDDYAFSNCTALKDIAFFGVTPPEYAVYSFNNVSATYYCYNSALAIFRIAFNGYKVISDDIRIASLQLAIATQNEINLNKALNKTITVLTTDWNNGVATKTIPELGDYDGLLLSPSTDTDKANIEAANIFPSTSGTTLTLTAQETPSSNITFEGLLIRGRI